MAENTKKELVSKKYKKRSAMGEVWHHMSQNKGAMIGLAFLIFLAFCAFGSELFLDYETDVIGRNIKEQFQGPSAQHWFGTDQMGRDILSRLLYGSRFSLSVGFVAVIIALFFGVTLGAFAGYYGGRVEDVIMRGTDIFASVPAMLMAICIVSALGANTINLMISVGVTSVPSFVRITRASVLTVRNQEFVEAARAIGRSEPAIIFGHVLPNGLSPVIVQTTMRIGSSIISASSLSFLGLGVPAPDPEWGTMLSDGRQYIRTAPHMTLFPGLAIMLTVLAFNMLGDALRDALDPKLKK
jgi:peptide/nickel transport system permease protein